MAQFPPRATPLMSNIEDRPSWQDFQQQPMESPYHMLMELSSTGSIAEYQSSQQQQQQQQHQQISSSSSPPWMDDEFAAFSSARRKAQRRMINDFLESETRDSLHELCHQNDENQVVGNNRFDDDQILSSMLSNQELMSSANGVTSSSPGYERNIELQQRSREEEKKGATVRFESEVVENYSYCGDDNNGDDTDQQGPQSGGAVEARNKTGSEETVIDPKRVKRILANRQSAQRSRVRKLQYITDLERSVTTLQAEVSTLTPRVAFLDHQRMLLSVDNSTLKAKIAALAQDKMFKDAHQDALRKEVERLKQVYYHKSFKGAAANGQNNPPNTDTNSSLQPFRMTVNHQPPYCEQFIH